MTSAQIGQRAPGWEAQPAVPPRSDQRLLITPAARAVFAASGQAPPAASRDGGVVRRADAVEQLSDSAIPARGEKQTSAAARGGLETVSRGAPQVRGLSAEEPAAVPTRGTLASSLDVRMGAAGNWSLAGLLSVCVRELASVGQGSVDATVLRGEDIASSGRGVRLHRAEQLVSAQIERALERGTDVYVGDSACEENAATSTLSLLVVDASGLGVDELVAADDGVAVSVGTPQRKVVPVDVGEGDEGVGIRVVMRLSITVGPDVPANVIRVLIENVSAFLTDDRGESAP